MRFVPERPISLQIITVFGTFFLGPWAALQTGLRLVPESDLVHTASVLAFVLVFVGGTLLWAGIGAAALLPRSLGRLVRARAPAQESPAEPSGRVVPPGYGAYIVLGCFAGVTVGLLAGVVTDLSIVRASAAWTIVGALYGLMLWAAAHHGYLPFSEPD